MWVCTRTEQRSCSFCVEAGRAPRMMESRGENGDENFEVEMETMKMPGKARSVEEISTNKRQIRTRARCRFGNLNWQDWARKSAQWEEGQGIFPRCHPLAAWMGKAERLWEPKRPQRMGQVGQISQQKYLWKYAFLLLPLWIVWQLHHEAWRSIKGVWNQTHL